MFDISNIFELDVNLSNEMLLLLMKEIIKKCCPFHPTNNKMFGSELSSKYIYIYTQTNKQTKIYCSFGYSLENKFNSYLKRLIVFEI
jgi:hypothetical protein